MKKGLVGIIIVLVLLLVAGGAFAFTYFATDLLKTDKQLFFKYFSQIITKDEFIDENINKYNDKKEIKPYENSGEFSVTADFPEEIGISPEKVNDLSIKYEGKIDKTNSKNEQKITIDYGNDVKFPLTYRQNGDSHGLQFDHFGKKFIVIENNNLQEFVQKFGIEDVSKIPNKIEIKEETQKIEFTDEEVEQLKQIYLTVLDEQLLDENFKSEKNGDQESYELKLTGEQIKNILLKMLETTKQNTLIIDKINSVTSKVDEEAEEITTDDIDEIIQSLNEYKSQLPSIKITLIQKDKKLNEISIESGKNKISILKTTEVDKVGYDVQIELKEIIETEESEEAFQEVSDDLQVKLSLNSQYTGIQALNNVQEAHKIGFEIDSEETDMKYIYQINNDVTFVETVLIDKFENNGDVVLNKYDAETITNFLGQVGMRLLAINANQMAELGLKAEQNPLLYSNPITMALMTFMNMANNTMGQVDLEDTAKAAFNNQFEMYQGENKRGSEVNALITTVFNHNISSSGSRPRNVKITLDGEELRDSVDTSKSFTVEAIYDIEGYVSEMKITTNN